MSISETKVFLAIEAWGSQLIQISQAYEKSGIKVLNLVNKLGVLRSQMPMPVDFLAKQMIRVSNRDSDAKVKKYNPKQIWKL